MLVVVGKNGGGGGGGVSGYRLTLEIVKTEAGALMAHDTDTLKGESQKDRATDAHGGEYCRACMSLHHVLPVRCGVFSTFYSESYSVKLSMRKLLRTGSDL